MTFTTKLIRLKNIYIKNVIQAVRKRNMSFQIESYQPSYLNSINLSIKSIYDLTCVIFLVSCDDIDTMQCDSTLYYRDTRPYSKSQLTLKLNE